MDSLFGIVTSWGQFNQIMYALTRRRHGMSGGMGPGFQLSSLGLSRGDALSMSLDEAQAQIRLLERENQQIIASVTGKPGTFNKDADGFAE